MCRKLYNVINVKCLLRSGIMAKNKPAFPSGNNKSSNGQESKGDIKTTSPTPKKQYEVILEDNKY